MELTKQLAEKYFDGYCRHICEVWKPYIWCDVILNALEQLKYMEAPASSKHHLSIPGGLYLHSVGVVERALKMRGGMAGVSPWEIMTAGLLHDVGKCGLLDGDTLKPRYISQGSTGYKVDHPAPDFTVRDLSALYASKWGLPWNVIQAILTHDGLYCPQNQPYIDTQSRLSLLLTNADNLQSKVFETTTKAYLGLAEGSNFNPEGAKSGQGDRFAPVFDPKAPEARQGA